MTLFRIIRKGEKVPAGWFTDALDNYLDKKAAASTGYTRKRTIRPSEIGSCTRKIVMSILNLVHEPPVEPKTQRVFDNGSWTHKRYLESYIPSLGCAAAIQVEQNGVMVTKPCIEYKIEDKALWLKGAPDAIIINAKDNLPYIFELKSIKQELFNELTEPSQEYLYQVYLYMHMTQIPRAIILYENKNNQEIKEFMITLDPAKLEEVLAKVKSIQDYVTNYTEANPVLPPKCDSKYCVACK